MFPNTDHICGLPVLCIEINQIGELHFHHLLSQLGYPAPVGPADVTYQQHSSVTHLNLSVYSVIPVDGVIPETRQ